MTVTLEVYEADHSTLVDTIDPGQWTRVRVTDVANLGGGGEVELPNVIAEGAENPALDLLTPGRVVRVVSDGNDIGSFALEQPVTTPLSPREEAGEITVVTGREPMAARFDKVRWHPDHGLGNLPFNPDRPLAFAADDLDEDGWTAAVGQLPNYDTDNYMGRPVGFVDTGGPAGAGPHWLADRDSRVTYAPGGIWFYRQRFTIDDDYDLIVQAAWDDDGELWIDDVPVLKSEGVYKGGCSEARISISEGDHLVAGYVRNLNELRTGIVFAGWSVSEGMADTLVFRSEASDAVVLGFPDVYPGFTPTEVLLLALDEAQDRGMLTDVTMDFTVGADTDAAAVHEVVDITVKAPADSLLTTCKMLSETYLDLAATRDDLELQAWIRGTRGTDRTLTVAFGEGTCAEVKWGSDFAEQATVALVMVEGEAPFEVAHPDADDLGRHEVSLDFGKCSTSSARKWARAYLNEVSYARRSIAVTLVPGVGPVPQDDFTVGDTVLVGAGVGPFTWGGTPITWGDDDADWGEVHRVHSIGLEVDATSIGRWTVELDQPTMLLEERLATIMRRQTPSAAGGRTVLPTPSTPSFPSVSAGSEDVHTWQFDGDPGDVQLLKNGTPISGAVVSSPSAGGTGRTTVTAAARKYVKGVDRLTLEVGSSVPSPEWVPPEGRWVQEIRATRDSAVDTTTITISVT